MELALNVLVGDNHTEILHSSINMCFDHILGVALCCCWYRIEHRILVGECSLLKMDSEAPFCREGRHQRSSPGTCTVVLDEYCAWNPEM